jgi:hypothetical protein
MYTDPSRSPFLGDFFDDLKNIADKISQGAMAAGAIKSGDAKVTVIPTQQGITNYAANLASGITPTQVALAIGGLGLLFLLTRQRGRR